MQKRHKITFSIDEDQLDDIRRYAEYKGYHSPSILARRATFAFMKRMPLKKSDFEKYEGDMKCPGGVYFIKAKINGVFLCKIGRAYNIRNRFNDINSTLPVTLELFKQIRCSNMIKAENAFHSLFADKRKKGEWFELSKTDYEDIESQGLDLIKKVNEY